MTTGTNLIRVFFLLAALQFGRAQESPALAQFELEPGLPGGSFSMGDREVRADSIALRDLLAFAHQVLPAQIAGPGWLNDHYRVAATASGNNPASFRAALANAETAQLHLREVNSTKPLPVLELKAASPELARARESSGAVSLSGGADRLDAKNVPIARFAGLLAKILGRPVIDETGLQGSYTFQLAWDAGDDKSLARACRDQLGLEWTEVRRDMPVITVERP